MSCAHCDGGTLDDQGFCSTCGRVTKMTDGGMLGIRRLPAESCRPSAVPYGGKPGEGSQVASLDQPPRLQNHPYGREGV
jgi:hypothetical protein